VTTLAVIADIHGNAPALAAVIEAVKDEVDMWLCAGDIAGGLPMVDETIDLLKTIGARCVLGNHDAALLNGTSIANSSAGTRALQIQRRIIQPASLAFLKTLPQRLDLSVDGYNVTIIHGSPDDALNKRLTAVDSVLRQNLQGSILITGHTHRVLVDIGADYAVFNPGTVGVPADGDKRARVLLLDLPERRVRVLSIPYDPGPVIARMTLLGYDERYANCLRAGRWVGFSAQAPQIPLIVVGASIYGEIVAFLIASHSQMRLVGFVDDTPHLQGTLIAGLPVLGKIDDLYHIAADTGVVDVAVAIGDNHARQKVAEKLKTQGVRLATLVHPRAHVDPSAQLAPGVIVDALSYVGPNCTLEEGVSVWPNVSVSHDTHIGAYASLKPGVVVGGQSRIEPHVKVPLGSVWPSYSTITGEP
jgi:sugar O-acyltransferase (sialic acid O-acetyltransferase NeuD family)/putative phosphoesterase